MSLLATAQLVKKALGSNPAFLQGVENILFLLIQGTVRSSGVLLNSRMRTESLALLCFVSVSVSLFIPDPDFYPSRIPGLGSRIPDRGSRIPDLGSRIASPGFGFQDPGSRIQQQKKRSKGKKLLPYGYLFVVKKQQIENISFLNRYPTETKFLSIDKEFKKYLLNKFSLSSQKYRLVIRDPRSGIMDPGWKKIRIRDPGIRSTAYLLKA